MPSEGARQRKTSTACYHVCVECVKKKRVELMETVEKWALGAKGWTWGEAPERLTFSIWRAEG